MPSALTLVAIISCPTAPTWSRVGRMIEIQNAAQFLRNNCGPDESKVGTGNWKTWRPLHKSLLGQFIQEWINEQIIFTKLFHSMKGRKHVGGTAWGNVQRLTIKRVRSTERRELWLYHSWAGRLSLKQLHIDGQVSSSRLILERIYQFELKRVCAASQRLNLED
jgi:hypothetical protein